MGGGSLVIRARSKRKPDIWFRYLLGTVWFIAGSPDMFSVGIKDSKETVCFLVQYCFTVRSRRSYHKLINVELEQWVLITAHVMWKTTPELTVHRCSTDVHDSTFRKRETSMACWKPEERLCERRWKHALALQAASDQTTRALVQRPDQTGVWNQR